MYSKFAIFSRDPERTVLRIKAQLVIFAVQFFTLVLISLTSNFKSSADPNWLSLE
jgi:hypothetical protein